jgi:HlyD family secretion protein
MTTESRWRFRPFLLLGYAALAALVLGLGSWGVTARISGAVIAPGQVEVLGNRQVVQHPTGGVVTEIVARDGDRVTEGDVLMRLEGDEIRAELAMVESQLFELIARQDRLESQRDAAETIDFSTELVERAGVDPDLAEVMTAQRDQFEARRDARLREREQLDERAGQIGNQIDGLAFQRDAIGEQIGLVEEELAAQVTLYEQGLTQMVRVLSARRDLAQLRGNLGQLEASIAENRARLVEIELEKLKLDTREREDAIAELRDLELREIELRARRSTLSEAVGRLEVRAPATGIVYGSTVETLRAVVRAAEPILFIVPQDIALIVRARIDAQMIDQVHAGQPAILRFPAFDSRTTPEVTGHVAAVSADVFTDEATRQPFYRVDIGLDPTALAELEGRVLVPGMPSEAFIQTDDRTPLTYLVKPFSDYFTHAFRER